MVDQKMMSLSRVLGHQALGGERRGRAEAEPGDDAPAPSGAAPGTQSPTAPRLWSHLPTPSPRTLSVTATASATSEKTMKYAGLSASPCHDAPPMKSALAAVK